MKIIVKDDFLEDPEHSRKLANTGNFEGSCDHNEYHWNDLKTKEPRDSEKYNRIFSKLLEEEVLCVDDSFRKYNICLERPDKKVHVHHHDVDYIAIVYLNHPELETDGTAIMKHIETGIEYKDEQRFGSEITAEGDWQSDSYDLSKWETKMFIPMKFNRLLIFEPRYYHTETRTFGKTIEEGRCVELFHIIKKEKINYWKEFWKEDIESGEYDLPAEFFKNENDYEKR